MDTEKREGSTLSGWTTLRLIQTASHKYPGEQGDPTRNGKRNPGTESLPRRLSPGRIREYGPAEQVSTACGWGEGLSQKRTPLGKPEDMLTEAR